MLYKYTFRTEEEKYSLIETHKDKYLLEINYFTECNFLVFSSIPTIEILQKQQGDKIATLEAQNKEFENALVELASLL